MTRPTTRLPHLPGQLRMAPARFGLLVGLLFTATVPAAAHAAPVVWLEAEAFADVGGWSRDTQHVDVMGSVYLLATGLGKPVEAAVTTAEIPETEPIGSGCGRETGCPRMHRGGFS